jgi:hypothetical protein
VSFGAGDRDDRALRREKIIGSSLEACGRARTLATPDELAELFIVSSVTAGGCPRVAETEHHKCGRCWRYLPEVRKTAILRPLRGRFECVRALLVRVAIAGFPA